SRDIERDLVVITDRTLALEIAERLQNTELAEQTTVRVKVARGARMLYPGVKFTVPGVSRALRVTSVSRSLDDSLSAEVVAAVDPFDVAFTGDSPGEIPGPGTPTTPAPDVAFDFIELSGPLFGSVSGLSDDRPAY